MATSSQLRQWWAAWRCDTSKFVRVPFPGQGRTWNLWVADESQPAWDLFIEAMNQTGYEFRESAGGTYNCRKISGTNSWSLHAYGLAVDLNPSVNCYGCTTNDYPPEFIALVDSIKCVDGTPAFTFGGRWNNRDQMHWQVNLSPLQVAKGLVWDGEEADMRLQRGDSGRNVAELQKMMSESFNQDNGNWSPFAGKSVFDSQSFSAGEDGDFGATCEANVKNVQQALGLAQSGVVDQLLWDALVSRSYGGGSHSHSEYAPKTHNHDGRYVKDVTVVR